MVGLYTLDGAVPNRTDQGLSPGLMHSPPHCMELQKMSMPGIDLPPFRLLDQLLNCAGDVVEYYIAANEVEWDYAPSMADMCSGSPMNLSDTASDQLTPSNFSLNIGHKQIKVLFDEYTDATFTTMKVLP